MSESDGFPLTDELRARIDDLHARVQSETDHYAVLGVPINADRKTIKRVYFEIAGTLHPDRFFRKDLGPYKAKLEVVFSKVTLAHDTLADRKKRADYDRYIQDKNQSFSIESLINTALAEAQRAEASVAAEIAHEEEPPAHVSSPPPSREPISRPTGADLQARKDALARRLLGGRAPPGRAVQAPAPAEAAVQSLKHRYHERLAQGKRSQAKKYITEGDEAAAKGQAVVAANAYRVALTLDPENEDVRAKAEKAQRAADEILSETYVREASYEESNGHWVQAARSWERAASSKPNDVHAHERAANAMLNGSGDIAKALVFAQRAVALAPTLPACQVTLAKAYMAASQPLSARMSLQTAAKLAPEDETIKGLLRSLEKSA